MICGETTFHNTNFSLLHLGLRVEDAAVSVTNYHMIDDNPASCNLLQQSTSLLSHQRLYLPHITTTTTSAHFELTITGIYLHCWNKKAFVYVLEMVPVEGSVINLYKTSVSKTCSLKYSTLVTLRESVCIFTCHCESWCTPVFVWKTDEFSQQHVDIAICRLQIKNL